MPQAPLKDEFRTTLFNVVRVVNRGSLPPNAGVVLPPMDIAHLGQQGRVSGRIYIEDHLPTGEDHHLELGFFMACWGSLESAVLHLIHIVNRSADIKVSSKVQDALSFSRSIELLRAISLIVMDDEAVADFENLLERLERANNKRNVLVHGQWVLEFALWGYKGVLCHKAYLLREVEPNDVRLADKIADFRNQKERVKHCFNLRRIRAASRDVMKLRADIGSFAENLRLKPRPVSAPYRVTYNI